MTLPTIRKQLLAAAVLSLSAAGCVGEVPPELPVEETPQPASEASLYHAADPIPGRYIVVFTEQHSRRTPETMLAMSSDLLTAHAASPVAYFENVIEGFVADMDEASAIALSRDPRVAFVEEDGYMHASAVQQNPTPGLDRIDQRALPLDDIYSSDATGAGVTAFVLDTGIRASHDDFGDRVLQGATFINDGNGTDDCNGHGTHVAGTIGGTVFGVAKDVKLVPIRVLGCTGSGATSGIIAGLDFVARSSVRPAVANLSLGGGASFAMDEAVRKANAAGVTVVVAAGNENEDACNSSPARAPDAISVGATTFTDRRAGFSNFGSCVDIFAPGDRITSLSNLNDTGTSVKSGTSMAAPHVAGVAALFLQGRPEASPADVASALIGNSTPDLVVDAKAGSPNKLLFTGFIDDGGENPPGEEPGEEPPVNGTPRTGAAAGTLATGELDRFRAQTVRPGTPIRIEMTGSGDADLYVRFNAAPTLQRFNCRPFGDGSNEVCEGTTPANAQNFQIMVFGFSAATYELDAAWVE